MSDLKTLLERVFEEFPRYPRDYNAMAARLLCLNAGIEEEKDNIFQMAHTTVVTEAGRLEKLDKARLKYRTPVERQLQKEHEQRRKEQGYDKDPSKACSDALRIIDNIIADETTKRLREILDGWMCEGIPLGECTFDHLFRARNREAARAEGHSLNAKFYDELLMNMSDQHKVADLGAEYIVNAFDTIFKGTR